MGHTNVAVYNEGLPEWVKRGYPARLKKVYPEIDIPTIGAAELKAKLDAKADVVVVDVRDEDDARTGVIAGSKNLDLEVLDSRYGELPKGKQIVLGCRRRVEHLVLEELGNVDLAIFGKARELWR